MIQAEIRLPKAYISVLGSPDLPGNSAIRGQYGRIPKLWVKMHRFCALFRIPAAPAGWGGTGSPTEISPGNLPGDPGYFMSPKPHFLVRALALTVEKKGSSRMPPESPYLRSVRSMSTGTSFSISAAGTLLFITFILRRENALLPRIIASFWGIITSRPEK